MVDFKSEPKIINVNRFLKSLWGFKIPNGLKNLFRDLMYHNIKFVDCDPRMKDMCFDLFGDGVVAEIEVPLEKGIKVTLHELTTQDVSLLTVSTHKKDFYFVIWDGAVDISTYLSPYESKDDSIRIVSTNELKISLDINFWEMRDSGWIDVRSTKYRIDDQELRKFLGSYFKECTTKKYRGRKGSCSLYQLNGAVLIVENLSTEGEDNVVYCQGDLDILRNIFEFKHSYYQYKTIKAIIDGRE